MTKAEPTTSEKEGSLKALQATNFFLADVQTGLGPFLAAYLADAGWEPGRVGVALTLGGIITVILQTPAGAVVDGVRSKRLILVIASGVLVRCGTAFLYRRAMGGVHLAGAHWRRRSLSCSYPWRRHHGLGRKTTL